MSYVFLLCHRLMRLLEVTAEESGYRQAWRNCRHASCFLAFAVLLVLAASALGMRPSSCPSPELAAHFDDDTQDDVPIADSWSIDPAEDSDQGGDDDDPRPGRSFSLAPRSAFTRCAASLTSRYQSFIFEPSHPPPRA